MKNGVIIEHFASTSTRITNLWDIDEQAFIELVKSAFMATLYRSKWLFFHCESRLPRQMKKLIAFKLRRFKRHPTNFLNNFSSLILKVSTIFLDNSNS